MKNDTIDSKVAKEINNNEVKTPVIEYNIKDQSEVVKKEQIVEKQKININYVIKKDDTIWAVIMNKT
ncbi:MAG: hypothetical protein U9Q66_03225 [Patescibacteria group bacterium]|nr:hypothetical protein [Patescibacteria group bacterium]